MPWAIPEHASVVAYKAKITDSDANVELLNYLYRVSRFTKIEQYQSGCSFRYVEFLYKYLATCWGAEQSMPKSWKRKEKKGTSASGEGEQVPVSALKTMLHPQFVRMTIPIKNWDASFMQTTPMMTVNDINGVRVIVGLSHDIDNMVRAGMERRFAATGTLSEHSHSCAPSGA